MGALQRDREETGRQLTKWLTEGARREGVTVGAIEIPAATGFSNETVLFDAAWRDGDDPPVTHRLVLRIAPQQYQVFLEANFEAQYRVMRALGEHSDVPIPRMLWYDADPAWFGSPFWIMERIDGQVPSDSPPYATAGWLHESTPAQQAQAWWSGIEAMAAVHQVDWRAAGLEFLDDTARGRTGLEQQLQYYGEYLDWAEDEGPHPGARAALARLRAEMPPPPAQGDALVWGDARLSNQIYAQHRVAAVLDWEMVAIGDPRIDLGWWLFCDETLSSGSGVPRLPGFPSREETVARWTQLTGRAGDDMEYFLLFAGLRFTVIMLRLGTLLPAMGFSPTRFGYDNPVSQALDRLLKE